MTLDWWLQLVFNGLAGFVCGCAIGEYHFNLRMRWAAYAAIAALTIMLLRLPLAFLK